MKGKSSSGKRAKKRRFHGNQHTQLLLSETETKLNISSSSSKLNSCGNTTSRKSVKAENSFKGFMLVDKQLLFAALEEHLVCKDCNSKVTVSDKAICGLSLNLVLTCEICGIISSFRNSNLFGERNKKSDVNHRAIYAMRCIGKGHESLKTFCGIMDLDAPVCRTTYTKISRSIQCAVKEAAVSSMKKATVQEIAATKNSTDLIVSGDGSWKTRGHTSEIGVCSVIGANSGKVLDVEVKSLACKGCQAFKGPKSGKKYEEWEAKHFPLCTKNHVGSSGKMEVDGMVDIFKRSELERGVRYTSYIGDGDTKTFSSIVASNPYSTNIKKIECVGHVQKRMGARLRKLKEEYSGKKLADGKSLSGKGRLTEALIKLISVYYGNAIRSNSDCPEKMKKSIWAIYFHLRSSDTEPLHSFCPEGENSWCKYQKALLRGEQNVFHHKQTIPSAVMDAVKPIFKALANPDLLKRCVGAYTQNNNESFNSLIWQICPKTSNCGKITAEIAVYQAILLFNDGRKSLLNVMRLIGVHPGLNAIYSQMRVDCTRIKQAEKRCLLNSIESRRAKKKAKLSESKKLLKKEGPIYAAGLH